MCSHTFSASVHVSTERTYTFKGNIIPIALTALHRVFNRIVRSILDGEVVASSSQSLRLKCESVTALFYT
jgi:uncharacterized protein (DUF427 family)